VLFLQGSIVSRYQPLAFNASVASVTAILGYMKFGVFIRWAFFLNASCFGKHKHLMAAAVNDEMEGERR
jgi:hypothetical protein